MNAFRGTVVMVNGKSWCAEQIWCLFGFLLTCLCRPNLNVARGQYLFRILDGSNLRFYNLSIVHDQSQTTLPFVLVAREGGYLRSAVTLSSYLLAPAQRVHLLVDFGAFAPGATFTLANAAPAPYPGGAAPTPDTAVVMRFTVTAQASSRAPRVLAVFSLLFSAGWIRRQGATAHLESGAGHLSFAPHSSRASALHHALAAERRIWSLAAGHHQRPAVYRARVAILQTGRNLRPRHCDSGCRSASDSHSLGHV